MLWSSVPIFSRLVARFNLQREPVDPNEAVALIETIQPVTQVDTLLRSLHLDSIVHDLSAGGAVFVPYWTVPAGKRWRIHFLGRAATTANSIVRVDDAGTGITLLTAAATAAAFLPLNDKPLDEGWRLGMTTTGDVGDDTVTMQIWYEELDAY